MAGVPSCMSVLCRKTGVGDILKFGLRHIIFLPSELVYCIQYSYPAALNVSNTDKEKKVVEPFFRICVYKNRYKYILCFLHFSPKEGMMFFSSVYSMTSKLEIWSWTWIWLIMTTREAAARNTVMGQSCVTYAAPLLPENCSCGQNFPSSETPK